jgi:HTH-type transcriptional regulator, competence development regulator
MSNTRTITMESVGQLIRSRREELGYLLKHIALETNIDIAILSKIERNERKPTKAQIEAIGKSLDLPFEDLYVQLASDKIVYEIANEDFAEKVLHVAERKIDYIRSVKQSV